MKNTNEYFDDDYDEEIELYLEKTHSALAQKNKLRARRKIEKMEDDKYLRQQIDNYNY